MTDTPELNVWREACVAYGGASIEGAEFEPKAAAVIRRYGDQRCEPLKKAVEDAIGYVQGQLGCSYCETDQSDWDFLHELEDVLGVPRTDKKSFYY